MPLKNHFKEWYSAPYYRSSLFHSTSVRRGDTNDTSGTSTTRTTRVLHERRKCYTNDASATRMKNFDFDNDTSGNIFSHSYISYTGEKRFHSKNYLFEMTRSSAKMHLKSAPQNLNFVMAKATSKSYTLDCSCKYPCTFPHSYAEITPPRFR